MANRLSAAQANANWVLHTGHRTAFLTPTQMPQFGEFMGLTANLVGLTADCLNTVIVEVPWLYPFALYFSQQINHTRSLLQCGQHSLYLRRKKEVAPANSDRCTRKQIHTTYGTT